MPIELDQILFRMSSTFYGAFLGVLTWSTAAKVIDWGDVANGDFSKLWPSFWGCLGILLSAIFFIFIWKKGCEPLTDKLKNTKGWRKYVAGSFIVAVAMMNAANSWIFYLIFTLVIAMRPPEWPTYVIISIFYGIFLCVLYGLTRLFFR